jgi:hypothetical protein
MAALLGVGRRSKSPNAPSPRTGGGTRPADPVLRNGHPARHYRHREIDAYRAGGLIGHMLIGRGKPLEPSTVQRDMTTPSAIFKRAVKRGWTAESPYDEAEKVKIDFADSDFGGESVHPRPRYAPRADDVARLSAFIAAQMEPNVCGRRPNNHPPGPVEIAPA